MKPHQERVIEERKTLDEKLGRLASFIASDAFTKLDAAEQTRMSRQLTAMTEYSAILGERIAAFTDAK